MAGATDGQIGALGEETASVWLEDLGATIVSMGDAGLPREDGRQELDLLAILDGALIAFEVKTRFTSKSAGHLTRAGNLPRPRLRKPTRPTGHRQGNQPYVAARVAGIEDTEDDYDGIDVRVIAIDLHAMLAQQFAVNDYGNRLAVIDPPSDCSTAAQQAFDQIIQHRGHL